MVNTPVPSMMDLCAIFFPGAVLSLCQSMYWPCPYGTIWTWFGGVSRSSAGNLCRTRLTANRTIRKTTSVIGRHCQSAIRIPIHEYLLRRRVSFGCRSESWPSMSGPAQRDILARIGRVVEPSMSTEFSTVTSRDRDRHTSNASADSSSFRRPIQTNESATVRVGSTGVPKSKRIVGNERSGSHNDSGRPVARLIDAGSIFARTPDNNSLQLRRCSPAPSTVSVGHSENRP